MATIDTAPHDARAMFALIGLCHHRWVVPVVAHLGRARGARFAVLQYRLSVAGTTLGRAIDAASTLGLVMRNPGHGHPLRPEYLLTPRGETLAPACQRVVVAAEALAPLELTRRKWTLPLLAALDAGASRWSHLQSDLSGCSPRALAQALEDLHTADWIVRDLVDERPPRPTYGLSRAAAPLARAAHQLAVAAR